MQYNGMVISTVLESGVISKSGGLEDILVRQHTHIWDLLGKSRFNVGSCVYTRV